MVVPPEDLQSIASILAAGYLRYRSQKHRQNQLANAATQSLHGHEVNASEKGEKEEDANERPAAD